MLSEYESKMENLDMNLSIVGRDWMKNYDAEISNFLKIQNYIISIQQILKWSQHEYFFCKYMKVYKLQRQRKN